MRNSGEQSTGKATNRASTRSVIRAGGLAALAGGLVLAAGVMPGCFGYRTVRQDPHMEVGAGGMDGVNAPTVTDVTVAAAAWVLNEHPVPPEAGGAALVNLAEGTRYDIALATIRRIDSRTGTSVARVTRERLREGTPVYHIGRVWQRGGNAKVDVIRPVFELGTDPNGRYSTQAITVELEGGLGTWRIVRHRGWAVDAVAVPAPNTWIEDEPGVPRPADLEETTGSVQDLGATVPPANETSEIPPSGN